MRLFNDRWVELPLYNLFRGALFAMGVGLLVLPFGYITVRVATAAALGAFPKPGAIRRATAFDPANPRLDENLGLIYQAYLKASPGDSVLWFRKATALEPNNGWYWEELGQACEFEGDQACATNSFAHALLLDPMSPQMEWMAANHDLLIGAPQEAAWHLRRLLEIDPQYADAVFSMGLRAYDDPEYIATHIVPAHSDFSLKLELLNFLARRNSFLYTDQLWSSLVSAHAQFALSQVDPYLEKLISAGRMPQAVRVWRDLSHLGILGGGARETTNNLIFNPGFEKDPLNAGFGWRNRDVRYIDAQFADPSAHQGDRCLRIDFDVSENETSEPVYQLVPVAPSRKYTLSAWVRSDQITSTSGPLLRVVDPEHSDCLQAATADTVGTTAWHEVTTTFSTCPTTQLVRVSIWRAHSYTFPNKIRGYFWIDEVMLTSQSQPGTGSAAGGDQ